MTEEQNEEEGGNKREEGGASKFRALEAILQNWNLFY